jgi:hypothetical protein
MKALKKLIPILALTAISFSSSASLVSFNDAELQEYGINQNFYGDMSLSTSTLTLDGNQWKSLAGDFTITSDTMLKFSFFSDSEGEIMGLGFDTDEKIDSGKTFKLAGTQNWGLSAFDNYEIGSGWQDYTIDIGSFYTGIFDRFFFVMDDDAADTLASLSFRNIQICEEDECLTFDSAAAVASVPVPATALLMLGGLALTFRRKRS